MCLLKYRQSFDDVANATNIQYSQGYNQNRLEYLLNRVHKLNGTFTVGQIVEPFLPMSKEDSVSLHHRESTVRFVHCRLRKVSGDAVRSLVQVLDLPIL